MKLILIRHGMTVANEKRLYCGSTDIGLSEKGTENLKEQKKTVGYPDINGMTVITSGKKRCEETLSVLFGDVAHKTDARFAEMDFGVFEMHSYDELKERPDYIEWISGDNMSKVAPSGESGKIMVERVLDGLRDLMSENKNTILVTHGGVIAAIMGYLFDEENKNLYEWQPSSGRGYIIDIAGNKKSYSLL